MAENVVSAAGHPGEKRKSESFGEENDHLYCMRRPRQGEQRDVDRGYESDQQSAGEGPYGPRRLPGRGAAGSGGLLRRARL